MEGMAFLDSMLMMLNTQTEKACSKCGVVQPLDRFCKSSGANYLRTECRDCERELGRVRRELKRTHPTPGDDHICPICKKGAAAVKGAGGRKSGHWCLDHDHKTNKFRGFICHTCNRALGQLQDRVDVLENAIQYLKQG